MGVFVVTFATCTQCGHAHACTCAHTNIHTLVYLGSGFCCTCLFIFNFPILQAVCDEPSEVHFERLRLLERNVRVLGLEGRVANNG